MLYLFAVLAKLLICCNLIADNLITTFAATNATKATKALAVSTILAPTSQHNVPHIWLRRQRRYLLFDKGSTMGIQGNIAKSLLPGYPRGLNEIYEYTFNYDLPTSLEMLRPRPAQAQQTQKQSKLVAKSKQKTTTTTMHATNFAPAALNESSSGDYKQPWLLPQWHATPYYWPTAKETEVAPWWQAAERRRWFIEQQLAAEQKQQKWQRQQTFLPAQQNQQRQQKQQWFAHTTPTLARKFAKMPAALVRPLANSAQQPFCHKRNVYGGSWRHHNSQHWCLAGREAFGRRRFSKRSSGRSEGRASVDAVGKQKIDDAGYQRIDEDVDVYHFATNAERVFFDLMGKWADIHNYPPHYCVMRTLCEYRHLLATPGHSLFHDLLRILIDAALPAARGHGTYKKAIWHDNLSDCAQHYATHCGLSFLQHFTEAVHGRFM